MADERIWTAALLVIGDEILSGRTQDKNVAQVATWLNRQGIRLAEVRVVPDVEARIADAVNALRGAHDYLFTTGGIGPTHDDITVDSIAAAFGVPVVVHPEARAILEDYYATRGGVTDARLRMARVPGGRRADRQSDVRRARREDRKRLHLRRRTEHCRRACSQALDGKLEGGRPIVSVDGRRLCGRERSRRPAARDGGSAAGVAIGSYPFFKDGRYGANFVMRSDDGELVDGTAIDLERRLAEAGIEPFPAAFSATLCSVCGDRLSSRRGHETCRTMKAGRRSS